LADGVDCCLIRRAEHAGEDGLAVDVLIAEDEPGILQSLDFILRQAGFVVHAETDGAAALNAIRNKRPRVVVLDVMMPKRSGFEVLRDLRADVVTRAIPVLMLTAKGQQQDRRTAEELGANAFITKPYANADVVNAVRRLIADGGTGSA